MKPITGVEIQKKIDNIFVDETVAKMNELIEYGFNKAQDSQFSSSVNKDKIVNFIVENHPNCKYEPYISRREKALTFLTKVIEVYTSIGWTVTEKECQWDASGDYYFFVWPIKET